MAQFCKTSFNTLRVVTYRSVVDEKIHIIGSVLRIGRDGSYLDNGHAGGAFVGIDTETGRLNDYLCDQYGNKFILWNGVNFDSNTFTIPNWDKVKEFATEVTHRNQRNRFLSMDLGLDSEGNPIIIECNIGGFSYWLPLFSGKTVFGEFTDEIIDYCAANQHRKNRSFML